MKELKEQCKAAGMKVVGNKSELMSRLAGVVAASAIEAETECVEEKKEEEKNEEDNEEEEEEALEVSEWVCPTDGKTYLKSGDGEVFDR